MTAVRGQAVVVTGAASGIGRLMALELATRGARVAVWDIDQVGMASLVRELERRGGGPHATYACDVGDPAGVRRVASQTSAELGPVQVLINNAGVVSGKSLLELSPGEIERTHRVNTLALFWTTRALLPTMMARNEGHVVTIASAAGLVGIARLVDYSASKFAAVGFDEALRMELRERAPGVRTTVVCPYFIDTGMFAGVQTRFSGLLPILEPERVAQRVVEAIVQNRRRVWMPPMIYTVPLLRLLPVTVFDAVARFFGLEHAMDRFEGRRLGGRRTLEA